MLHAAGVDRSIVSRVTNGDPGFAIRAETRARVIESTRVLGYQPNAAARSLRAAQARAFDLIIPNCASPIYTEVTKGAEEAAIQRGFVLFTASEKEGSLGALGQTEILGNGRVDGLLLAGANSTNYVHNVGKRISISTLFLNRRVRGIQRFIIFNNASAARLAVDYLAELSHRLIAYIAGPPDAGTASRRLSGYVKALRRHGLPVNCSHIVTADYLPAGGARALEALMSLPTPPTAVVAANTASAVGALSGVRRVGACVPERLSIVAIHDLELADYLVPPLTTIKMPLRELAARGVELLTTANADDQIAEVLDGEMKLMRRESTAEVADLEQPSGEKGR